MAHIPYGYRIIHGRAVIEPEEAAVFRRFVDCFLAGLSVRQAMLEAGLLCSQDRAAHMLRRELYAGDGYYPPILTREMFEAVQAELSRRTHPGQRKPEPASPVRSKFRTRMREQSGSPDALRRFEEAYAMIEAAEDGAREQSRAEQTQLLRWQQQT